MVARGGNTKKREIRYCSHIDRCVYQRYGFLIDAQYNLVARAYGIDEAVIAYRTNVKKSTIDYASCAFDFIGEAKRCFVFVSDFSKFFDFIDHLKLKQALCKVLECERLPPDYYAVFKSLTKYSSWEWKSLLRINGLDKMKDARKRMNEKGRIITEKAFRKFAKTYIKQNENNFGIPQGSPMSATLSNVYMIDFDRAVTSLVNACNGLYYRYCDDLLIILPFEKDNEQFVFQEMQTIAQRIISNEYADVNKEKTNLFRFDVASNNEKVATLNKETNEFECGGQLDYLGLIYDGERRYLRPKSVSKYHRRMQKKISHVHENQSYENVYKLYTDQSHAIVGKSTFIDYARNARRTAMLEDPQIDRIIDHNMETVGKKKRKYKL